MRVAEFYSGIGGLHWALKQTVPGAEVVCAFDINEIANDVYQHNFGFRPRQGQIQNVSLRELDKLKADMWLLSPPCQPYTRQGLKKGSNDRRAISFLDLLDKLGNMRHAPRCLLLENVVGFESSETRRKLMEVLHGCGYNVQEFIVSPNQLGIPYSRPRYFCLAKKGGFVAQDEGDVFKKPPSMILESKDGAENVSPIRLCDFLDGEKPNLGTSSADAEIIDHDSDDPWADFWVPPKLQKQCADVINIVTRESLTSNCFTKSYVRYVKGTGAVLATQNEHLLPRVEKLQDFCCNGQQQAPTRYECSHECETSDAHCGTSLDSGNHTENSDVCHAGLNYEMVSNASNMEIDRGNRQEAMEELNGLLSRMCLRYFTPREVASLHSFPKAFEFPGSVSMKQRYALLGNSLNVTVVADLLMYLVKDS